MKAPIIVTAAILFASAIRFSAAQAEDCEYHTAGEVKSERSCRYHKIFICHSTWVRVDNTCKWLLPAKRCAPLWEGYPSHQVNC